LFKEFDPADVKETNDTRFKGALSTFTFALETLADETGKRPSDFVKSYNTWSRLEADVVAKGLDQRLTAYDIRYGPESERINALEWFTGELLFKGTEAGPSAWEPISRLTPVQFTSAGPGLVSTIQAGMNYYFLDGDPGFLKWIGIKNHVGFALAMQYLSREQLANFKGKPSYGFVVHMDRREIGMTWDEAEKQVRVTLGYAFQFVPLAF
jgi:hypothetical protein